MPAETPSLAHGLASTARCWAEVGCPEALGCPKVLGCLEVLGCSAGAGCWGAQSARVLGRWWGARGAGVPGRQWGALSARVLRRFWGAHQGLGVLSRVLGCPLGARQGGSRHPEHLRQGGCVAVPSRPLSAPKCFGIRHLMRTKEINWWFRPNETAVQINSPHQQKQTESLNELLRSITLSKLLPG